MTVTVVATLCHLLAGLPSAAAPVDICEDVVVASSDTSEGLDMLSCQVHGPAALAVWKEQHPVYHYDFYRITKWGCVSGTYVPKNTA